MNKEQQDKLWNELSEEKKEKYRKDYKEAMEDCGESALIVRRELLAEIFGTHNLNPEPVKREGWVNVYKEGVDYVTGGKVFSTKSKAESEAIRNYVATVKIEWEE